MYPPGHARNAASDLEGLLRHKWVRVFAGEPTAIERFEGLKSKTAAQVQELHDFELGASFYEDPKE